MRGPSISERRAVEEAEEMAKAAAKEVAKKAKKSSVREAVVQTLVACAAAAGGAPLAACVLGRGRAARNTPISIGGDVQNMEKRKATLMKKAEWRPTRKLTDVGPAGSSKLDDMPDRDDFAAGAEGAAEFSEIMLGFVDRNFTNGGIEAR